MNETAYALALGKFDALHLGHRALVQEATAYAQPLLISFSGMAEVLGWEARAPLIATECRAAVFADWSSDNVTVSEAVIPFAEVRSLNPDEFISYLQERWHVAAIITGEDFRFAYQRAGDVTHLRRIGEREHFTVRTVPPQMCAGGIISSSRVRQAVDDGDMVLCRQLLGRYYRITGEVVHGEKRGRSIGFPTANISAINNHIPAIGVYAARVVMEDGTCHQAAVNIGHLPSIGHALPLTVEAHIFDWQGDCYGQSISLHVLQRIRGEQQFSGLDALKKQIAQDVADIRALKI